MTQPPKKSGRALLGGLAGGGFSALVLQPLDMLKSRQQAMISMNSMNPVAALQAPNGFLQSKGTPTLALSSVSSTLHQVRHHSAIATAPSKYAQFRASPTIPITTLARTIVRDEGALALWRGVGPSIARITAGAGLYLGILDYMASNAGEASSATASAAQNFAVGAGARALACTFALPFTVVKTRFEALPANTYSSLPSALRQIFRAEGFRGSYSGLGVTLLRDVPFSGLYYLTYEALHRVRADITNDETRHTTQTFAVGLLAGAIATTVTHPFDMIKTRVQLGEHAVPSMFASTTKTNSALDVAKQVVRSEGAFGLFRGLTLRIVKRPLTTAVVWTAYEFARRMNDECN